MPGFTDAQQERREQGPVTERGIHRKEELMIAARRVFEARGFIESRVSDIVKEANVSHGTFYTYFETKEAIFTSVARSVIDSMLVSMSVGNPSGDFHFRVRESVRRFVDAYRPNAKMISLVEHVATYSPELRDLRLSLRESFVKRTERGIRRMQDEGNADLALDVEYTAEVLGAMLDYTCYLWFVLDSQFDSERLVDTLTEVWEKAIVR